jgi:hypothetical protein
MQRFLHLIRRGATCKTDQEQAKCDELIKILNDSLQNIQALPERTFEEAQGFLGNFPGALFLRRERLTFGSTNIFAVSIKSGSSYKGSFLVGLPAAQTNCSKLGRTW